MKIRKGLSVGSFMGSPLLSQRSFCFWTWIKISGMIYFIDFGVKVMVETDKKNTHNVVKIFLSKVIGWKLCWFSIYSFEILLIHETQNSGITVLVWSTTK